MARNKFHSDDQGGARWLGPAGNRVFVLGREREKTHAVQYLKAVSDTQPLYAGIDAVHDLLEEAKPASQVIGVFEDAFVNGGSGTWEQTGAWIRKLQKGFPELLGVWFHAASHPSARVRFRAAAFLNDMPPETYSELLPHLLSDASAKVRQKAATESGSQICD